MKSKWNTPLVENVGFEPLFLTPRQECSHYTTFSIWCRRWDSNPRSVFQAELFKSSMYVTPSLRHIRLSVQQSTVFPICQYSSTFPSANELVGIIGFEPIRLSTLEFESSVAAKFHHIPILPVFPGCQPRAGHFRRKKYHDTSLIILTKITIKCLFCFSSSADLHKTRSAAE